MILNKGEGNVDNLKKVIEEKIENTTVQIGGLQKKTIIITNIDGTTKKEEIIRPIEQTVGPTRIPKSSY